MSESSACLLRSLSQPSTTSQESTEGDAIQRALTSSISFGRFMSESLAWEKWSSFNQNRYLEEAEKSSKPGSVAEKKAYFEAHYKKIAAKKAAAAVAAALLEQQSSAVENVSVVNTTNQNDDDSPIDMMEPTQECEHIALEEMQGETTLNTDVVFQLDANQQSLPKASTNESIQSEGVEQAIKHPIFAENQVQSPNQIQVVLTIHDNQEMKTCSKDALAMGILTSSEEKETAFSSGKLPKRDEEPKISAKPKVPLYSRKGDHATTPSSKKTASQCLEKKRSTPKSLHMSMNFPCRAYDTNNTSSPISKKIVGSRQYETVGRTLKETSKPQIPTRASVAGMSKHLSVNPQLGKRRTTTPLDRKSTSPWMHMSKSKTTCESKAQSSTVTSSFGLRSEERAAKRKEKLEQRLSTQKAEKEQQSNQKVKPNGDSRDVWGSASFKAKANTDFHLGTQSPSIAMMKISTPSCSTKLERKQASEMHFNNSRPPWRVSTRTDSFRNAVGKNLQSPAYSAKLFPKKNARENTSPNIQL